MISAPPEVNKNGKVLFVMYSVFGDESHDEKAERIYTVAGIGGTEEEWKTLEKRWLQKTDGKVFRPADCESDKNQYDGLLHEENQRLYRDLVRLLLDTKMLGFGASVDLRALREYVPDPHIEDDVWPYFHCFSRVLEDFLRIGRISIPQQKVKFSFHVNQKTRKSASALSQYLLELPEEEDRLHMYLADEISFIKGDEHIGIQVACLFARETMKHFDNFFVGPRTRRVRASMEAMLTTKRFRFFYFDKGTYDEYNKSWLELKNKHYLPDDDYTRWLDKNHLQHNFSNGIRYLDYVHKLPEPKKFGES